MSLVGTRPPTVDEWDKWGQYLGRDIRYICRFCMDGTGELREFLYVDDLANLCVFLMNNYSGDETVNAGTGKELTI